MDSSTSPPTAAAVRATLTPLLRDVLRAVNELQFEDVRPVVGQARALITEARGGAGDDDDLLRDLFVLDRYVGLFESYSNLWAQILARRFAASWGTLQDALDQLRLVKRFSDIDVAIFEDQLLQLESAYPYRIFLSIGAVVARFDCSICGRDIDGFDCPHRRGELHRGKLVYGIAREVAAMDHVSFVTDPEDKRCVVILEDDSPQFKLIDYIRGLIEDKSLQIIAFDHLRWSKRRIPNPHHVRLGRNESCYCGSGRKFKRCCESRASIDQDHVDVIASTRDIAAVV